MSSLPIQPGRGDPRTRDAHVKTLKTLCKKAVWPHWANGPSLTAGCWAWGQELEAERLRHTAIELQIVTETMHRPRSRATDSSRDCGLPQFPEMQWVSNYRSEPKAILRH